MGDKEGVRDRFTNDVGVSVLPDLIRDPAEGVLASDRQYS